MKKWFKDSVDNYNSEIKGSLKWSAGGKFGWALQFPPKGDSYAHHDVFNADPDTVTAWTKLKDDLAVYWCGEMAMSWLEKGECSVSSYSPVFMWHVKGRVGRINGKKAIAN